VGFDPAPFLLLFLWWHQLLLNIGVKFGVTTLGIIMIVKNEERWLPDCLKSVQPIADEIVIADTGSTDRSKEIAREFGARVFDIPWHDDFAEARNRGMSFAESDWLLHLDADEVLDPSGRDLIRSLVDYDGAGADAIEVTLANYCNEIRSHRWVSVPPDDPMARGCAGYIGVQLVRLFRNHCGVEYREAVHENVGESLIERGLVVRREPIIIHHYGMAARPKGPGPKDYFYLRLNEKKVRQRPNDAKTWQDYGAQLIAVGELEAGEKACRRALELRPDFLDAAVSLCNVLLLRNAIEEARRVIMPFMSTAQPNPQLATALATIYLLRGAYGEAYELLRRVLNCSPDSVVVWLYLARVLDLLGQPEGARTALETACALAPALEETRNRLNALTQREEGRTRFSQGDMQGALEKFVRALTLDPEDPTVHNDIGVVLARMGFREKAMESFRRALQLAPVFHDAAQNLASLTTQESSS